MLLAVTMLGVGAPAHARGTWISFRPEQIAVTAGGGPADFVGSTMRSNTRFGADWDARVVFGTRTPIGFEAGYAGLYNTLSTDRFSFGTMVAPYMLQNSFDGALRINLVPWNVEPYIFGGVGYNHVSVVNRDQDPTMAAKFRPSDEQLLVPAGGGVAAYFWRHYTIDARFTYRAVFFEDVMVTNPDARQDTYTVAARFGYVF